MEIVFSVECAAFDCSSNKDHHPFMVFDDETYIVFICVNRNVTRCDAFENTAVHTL